MTAQRWRALRTELIGGRQVAVVRDTLGNQGERGAELRVYYRLGRWRFYRDDQPVTDHALAATARRQLKGAP